MAGVLVVTGPSGVGKGTLIRELLERAPGLTLSVSATTRPPRPGEVDGRDYHFLSEEEFEKRLLRGEFLEHAMYAGNHEQGSSREVIKPRLDKLLEQVDSNYAAVIVSAKRARQINSYYHNLGEGTFDEYPPPMVETDSKNYLKISLEEIAAGKIKYRYRA